MDEEEAVVVVVVVVVVELEGGSRACGEGFDAAAAAAGAPQRPDSCVRVDETALLCPSAP